MIGGASVRYRTNAELFFVAPVLAPRQLQTFAHPNLRVVTAPFDRDQAERARIKFIEPQMLIDAIGHAIDGERARPAAA